MSNVDIIRAWKDEEYRDSLSEEDRENLPENPAGLIELDDTDLKSVGGGVGKKKKKGAGGPPYTIPPVFCSIT